MVRKYWTHGFEEEESHDAFYNVQGERKLQPVGPVISLKSVDLLKRLMVIPLNEKCDTVKANRLSAQSVASLLSPYQG